MDAGGPKDGAWKTGVLEASIAGMQHYQMSLMHVMLNQNANGRTLDGAIQRDLQVEMLLEERVEEQAPAWTAGNMMEMNLHVLTVH